ncbi:hypothetical protein F3Y22_tig00111000pilonHSYRG00101 [Hibiscus syriacus]|uniref:Aminotransferase class I/classII domain-containing protein n=1 Tax=Hibiscus syriacus TaxID=106335 RepID=A0A6A2Z9I2_HIBSY|nr:hypothetical protein F3Y22_tig00111000pilonHSYRG00101 [Hibiscus syriacus]
MEKRAKKWGFEGHTELKETSAVTVRGVLNMLMEGLNKEDSRPVIPLGHGDPSHFPSLRTAAVAENAIIDSLRSAKYNCYSPTVGVSSARRAIADYRNRDLPYTLSPDDVYLKIGWLLPWTFDSLQLVTLIGNEEKSWYLYIAETARNLGLLLIGDEAYDNLAFGSTPYVPVRAFGSTVPVLTLGSISKRWIVRKSRLVDSITGFLDISSDPATFIQIICMLREGADMCYNAVKEIPFVTCPKTPEGSMSAMVKLDVSMLEDINDDIEFCLKLAEEESVIVLPGRQINSSNCSMDRWSQSVAPPENFKFSWVAVGLKNWLRITFAVEPSILEEELARIKVFCQRHAKKAPMID